MLALSLGIASALVGCSSNPKKEVVDTGPQSSEQVYFNKAERALERGQYSDAAKQLEALDTYFPTGQYAQQAHLSCFTLNSSKRIMKGRLLWLNVLSV